jgi:membrane protein
MLSIYRCYFQESFGTAGCKYLLEFFLSLFPMILFFLSVLPFMPHYDKLQFYIFEVLMPKVFPSHMQSDVTGYIQSSLIPNMKSISNFTILLSFIFATNGCFSLLTDLTGIQNFSELL